MERPVMTFLDDAGLSTRLGMNKTCHRLYWMGRNNGEKRDDQITWTNRLPLLIFSFLSVYYGSLALSNALQTISHVDSSI